MNRYALLTSVFALSLCLLGCTQETASTDDAPAVDELAVTDAMLVALQNADMVDGTEDKVVSQCYSCQLGMSGDEKFTHKVGDYTCNFCKDVCREHFANDPEFYLTSVEIPEGVVENDGRGHDDFDHEGHDHDDHEHGDEGHED